MNKSLLCLLIIPVTAFSYNLITNGDFEQDLTTGWTASSYGSYDTITRGTTYNPDPDYEAYVFKGLGSGYSKLDQTVNVPLLDLDFSIQAKMYAYDNNADTLCWAAAAVIITYQNDLGNRLGDTRILIRTTPCPWINNSTTHLITVTDSLWHNYAFNVQTELGNLPGVNPSQVKKISIALYDTTAHTC